ncbi:MAG: CPBP family intramembrane metalloprotease [Spirochaetales bacterium]|nr:CPBP family intramembrane metalloprotease [Spirochaetales bacterium]
MREYSTSRILALISISLFSFLVLGLCLTILLFPYSDNPIARYVTLNIPHLLCFIALAVSSHLLLGFSIFKLSTDRENFSFRLFFLSFSVALVPILLTGLLSLTHISFTFDPRFDIERIVFFSLIIIITPLQCFCEELIFRVLLARLCYKNGLEGGVIKALLVSSLSGLLFLLPHLFNNEVNLTKDIHILYLYYFLFGFLTMILAIYLKGFEASVAFHAAINLFSALIINYKGSSLPTHPLIMLDNMENPIVDVMLLSIVFILLIIAVTWAKKRSFKFE